MDIEYFHHFIEVVKHKSITKASEKLNLTHPALSKQIRRLESYYGVTLLKRSASGVELTEAGHQLYTGIQPILQDLAKLHTRLEQMGTQQVVRLGTLPSLAAYYLPRRVLALEKKGIKSEIIVRNTSAEVYELLGNGRLDAAVIEHIPAHQSLWSTVLFTDPLCVVACKSDSLAARESVSIDELAELPLILNPPDCGIRKKVTSLMNQHQITPRIKSEVAFGDFILGYVAAGAGITIVPAITAEHIAHPQLTAIPLVEKDAFRTIALLAHQSDLGETLQRSFLHAK